MSGPETTSIRLEPSAALARLGIEYQAFEERSTGQVRRLEGIGSRPLMVVSFGAPVSIGQIGKSSIATSAFCVGIGTPALLSEHGGQLRCVEVSAPAMLAERLWPGLSSEYSVLPLQELWRPEAVNAVRDAAEEGDLVKAVARLDRVLSSMLASNGVKPDEVADAMWRGLVATSGRARIGKLAAAIGVSERHAIAKFGAAVGVTPKMAARRLRFVRARRLLSLGYRLADIAYACGYADQSHFTREFTMFAGEPPGRRR